MAELFWCLLRVECFVGCTKFVGCLRDVCGLAGACRKMPRDSVLILLALEKHHVIGEREAGFRRYHASWCHRAWLWQFLDFFNLFGYSFFFCQVVVILLFLKYCVFACAASWATGMHEWAVAVQLIGNNCVIVSGFEEVMVIVKRTVSSKGA